MRRNADVGARSQIANSKVFIQLADPVEFPRENVVFCQQAGLCRNAYDARSRANELGKVIGVAAGHVFAMEFS
jgi:hypothetical protein